MTRDHRLPIGTVLAGHTVEQVLGQGGFGITYRVRENRTGAKAALKEFFPSDDAYREGPLTVRAKPDRKDRFDMGRKAFLEEARTLNALPAQRGLVRIKGAFEKHATVYALMDFIDGEPLDRATRILLERHPAVPLPLLEDLLESMIGALQAIHGVGVLHRDIKPGNIMIRRDGQPILIDFGAARPMTGGKNLASMFSRRYAALEQFPPARTRYRATSADGPAVDLFALSVLMYELVSHSLPPDAEERFTTLRKTARDPYLPVRDNMNRNRVRADYPAILLDTIDLGCRLLPRERIRSAQELTARLGGLVDPKGTHPEAAPEWQKATRPGRSQRTNRAPRPHPQPTVQPDPAQKLRLKLPGALPMILLILALAAASVVFGLLMQ